VECIQALGGRVDGALINAGAYSHTSLAIQDAFRAVNVPFVEVHISNIFAREPERRHSTLAGGALALLCGFGTHGYELALRGLVAKLASRG
jgi:3-dehydroquinate dehydratase-2